MARGKSDKWLALRRLATSRADSLVSHLHDTDLPVPLAPLAEASGVNRFEFRPLLMDGALAPSGEGFTIFLDCPSEAAEGWRNSMENASDQGRSIPAASRFTVAHEVAHTFFFRRQGCGWQPFVSGEHPKELASLEATCNEAAARMLVPEALLKSEFARGFPTAPQILSATTKFNVSPHVLIGRMGNISKFSMGSGVIAIISQRGDGLRLRAIAADSRGEELLPLMRRGKPADLALKMFGLGMTFLTDETRTVMCSVRSRRDAAHRVTVSCAKAPDRNFWVLAAYLHPG